MPPPTLAAAIPASVATSGKLPFRNVRITGTKNGLHFLIDDGILWYLNLIAMGNMSERVNSPNYVVCHCERCDGPIEFDANQLAEDNVTVSCPHCGLETKLSTSAASPRAVQCDVSVHPPSSLQSAASSEKPVTYDHRQGRFPKGTRVTLTPAQIETSEGQELVNLLIRIEDGGFVTEKGVRQLHEWLETRSNSEVRAVLYLLDLSRNILGCGGLTMDNAFEMQLAIERVLPKHIRDPIVKKRSEIEGQLPASEKTLAHIRELGGNPQPGMTRAKAFELEYKLNDPATENQIAFIRRLGGIPSPQISFQEASALIEELLHSTKATRKQIQFIRDLGGNPRPGLSRAEAETLIPQLQAKQYETLARQQPPTQRQTMVLRFWNRMDLAESSKWEIEKWLAQFYEEDSRRKEAWEIFKSETHDDGSQHDPSTVPIGVGELYLHKLRHAPQ